MSHDPNDALIYVTFLADKLGLPLTDAELWKAADRAVTKPVDLAPLYAAVSGAPVEGATTYRPPLPPRPPLL